MIKPSNTGVLAKQEVSNILNPIGQINCKVIDPAIVGHRDSPGGGYIGNY